MSMRVSVAAIAALSFGLSVACASDTSDEAAGAGDGDGGGGGGVVIGSGGSVAGTGGGSTGAGGTVAGTGGGSVGAGGSSGSGGSASLAPCSPFSNFEAGDSGFGVYANDNAAAGSLTMPVGAALEGPIENDATDGANGTTGSLAYAGSGFEPSVAEAGPGGVRFSVDPISDCQDVSAATGLSFWAKGTVSATTEWGGIDANTMIVYLVADALDEGATQVDYRLTIDPTGTWAKYQIPFADFGIEGYSASTVQRVKFLLAGGTFDVALDEVGFY